MIEYRVNRSDREDITFSNSWKIEYQVSDCARFRQQEMALPTFLEVIDFPCITSALQAD